MDFEQVVQTYELELSQMMMNCGTKELSELESAAEVGYMWFLWQIVWHTSKSSEWESRNICDLWSLKYYKAQFMS